MSTTDTEATETDIPAIAAFLERAGVPGRYAEKFIAAGMTVPGVNLTDGAA